MSKRIEVPQAKQDMICLIYSNDRDCSLERLVDFSGLTVSLVKRILREGGVPFNKKGWRKGRRGSQWKGGRRMLNGYVLIYAPKHPYATADGYVFEHRLVMEEMVIGRLLRPDEIVHHKDGDKQNNTPENLGVMSRSRHTSHHHPRALRFTV